MPTEYELAIRERIQVYMNFIKSKKILDPIQQIKYHQKMVEDCLLTLGKILDRTYTILSPEKISKEMFGE